MEFGVWGGMTERERRALLRRRPDVTSWRELLDAARRAQKPDEDCRVS
jgi:WhiB family redox-sensing transcriptional regulator